MKTLKIKWQRFVSDGKTCPRCRTTGEEIKKAVPKLKETLRPLGVKVVFEKEELSATQFKDEPLKSNMIMFNNHPLEDWIGGRVGQSQCCDICGPSDCRTTEIEGEIYEEIPADLIIKAGLLAASNLINPGTDISCCDNVQDKSSNSSCC